jgi:hypothetical protein
MDDKVPNCINLQSFERLELVDSAKCFSRRIGK